MFRQANVSAVYRVPISENSVPSPKPLKIVEDSAGPSHRTFDPEFLIKDAKNLPEADQNTEEKQKQLETQEPIHIDEPKEPTKKTEPVPESSGENNLISSSSKTSLTKENLMRRLNIEEEVTFVSTLVYNGDLQFPIFLTVYLG